MAPGNFLARAFISGTLAAGATAVVASWLGRRETGSASAALNATSHVAWGDRAGRRNAPSLKYTGAGFALNYGACVFWALLYEGLGRPGRPRGRALRDGTLVAAAAYVTDYHLVPHRLTPGFELRLSGRALGMIYAALGLGLCVRDLALRRRAPAQPEAVGAPPRTASTMYGFAASQDLMKLAAGDEGGASRDPKRKKREVPDLTGKKI